MLTRRSFVAGSAVVLGAMGARAAALRPACADEPGADAAYAAELSQSVEAGATVFFCPHWWQVASERPDEDTVRIEVLDEGTGQRAGHVAITAGSPVEASRSWRSAHAVFTGLAASEVSPVGGAAKSVWNLERIDRDGIAMVRALCAEAQGQSGGSGMAAPHIGLLYMALAPDWTLVYMEALVEPKAFEAVAPLVEAVWDRAVWPAAVTDATVGDAMEDFRARALRRGRRRNVEHPYYNPYWDIVGFECEDGGAHGGRVYQPFNARYVFATPEGFEGGEGGWSENAIVRHEVGLGYDLPPVSLWCIERADSDGVPYLRSTVEVEGLGVVDVAWYEDLGPSWYVADTGAPVFPIAAASGTGESGTGEPWAVVTGSDGNYVPWQDAAGG